MTPGYVFNIGDSQYVASKIDDKEMFQRTITHKDKESDFLRWYNHGGTEGDDVHRFELFKCL